MYLFWEASNTEDRNEQAVNICCAPTFVEQKSEFYHTHMTILSLAE